MQSLDLKWPSKFELVSNKLISKMLAPVNFTSSQHGYMVYRTLERFGDDFPPHAPFKISYYMSGTGNALLTVSLLCNF